MFVYSFKASTLKFFSVIGLALITLIALAILIPTYTVSTTKEIATMNESISFDKVKKADDVVDFLKQYGWEVIDEPIEEDGKIRTVVEPLAKDKKIHFAP